MKLNVCIWNYADLNNGVDNWEWFELPTQETEMHDYMNKLRSQGKEEFFICDSDHSFITSHTNIKSIIELSHQDEIDLLDEYFEIYPDNIVYCMDMFNDIFHDTKPIELANMIKFGNYKTHHDHFTFDGYGNIETLSDARYEELELEYIDEMAKEFLDHN